MSDSDFPKNLFAPHSQDKSPESSIAQSEAKRRKKQAQLLDSDYLDKLSGASDDEYIGLAEEYAYKGSPVAQVALGEIKLHGNGLEKSTAEAIFWLKRALSSQNADAALKLHTVYSQGLGVRPDPIKARRYIKIAADSGLPNALFVFAQMLIEGEGGDKDEDAAIEYMYRAAKNGYKDAIVFLSENELTIF
ncbi:sel1 repeat family protein [Vibrio sp. SCSIO 43132]|uniref:tetratricopeptide repeat protein n=1 Tax=Vibrio TaxID=662 RepID=UPI0005FA6FB8|nr:MULTISPECIES: tetratricopeptide repeat protein [Vibrio]KJY76430.1 hypothetical protein TW74_15345 [Vibrio nigripulchritudo]UAB72470.1 sel1 repeat family protein [Vibrio sp. SCSIO 43132]